MVEFALVIILFLGVLMAIWEGARLVTSYFALANAAREGARAGIYTTASDATIQDKVRQTLPAWISVPNGNITICRRATSSSGCGTTPYVSGSVIDVTVTYTFHLVPFAGGWLSRATVPLTGYHRARVE